MPATVLRANLLGSPEPETPEWFELRRQGITATDMPKILGMSGYGNALSVWHEKRGQLAAFGESEDALWGKILEDPVAQEWARRNDKTVSRVGVLAHLQQPWMRASCDRLIDGTNAALEVKTRSAYVAGSWRDELPDDVLAQVAWQRAVGRFDYVEVACLLGGQRMTTFRYEKDTALESYLRDRAYDVWKKVQSGEPPVVPMDGVLIDLLNQLYPDRSGELAIDRGVAADLLLGSARANARLKLAEEEKRSWKARILDVMGDHEVLTIGGEPLFTYRAQTKSSINVRDLEDNDPKLFLKVLEGGHITTTTSRVLRTGKGDIDGE